MYILANGRLITRDGAVPYLPDGGVAIDGTKIAAVGSTAELKAKYPEAEFVDAKGGVIMPGLVNAHTHIYSALARGLSIDGYAPTTFYEVLDGQWWYIDRRAVPGLHQAGRHHHLRPPRLLRGDPRLPVPDRGQRQGVRHPLLPLLRGQRPGRRGEVRPGHPGERRLHHLL